jgi:antitoxin (DNA-binding transcriptional repressor) of toxin-antitoxin stability system
MLQLTQGDFMTRIVNLSDNVSMQTVIALTRNGDEVVIEENGEPLARLLPIQRPEKKERVLGLREGQVWISDDFDEPLPDSFWLGEEE